MFKGSIVALVTPMNQSGAIDENALEKLIDWHLTSGTEGLVIAGTTGESATLTELEKITLIKKTVEQVNAKIPVIAGTGLESTEATIQMTSLAMRAGANAALIMTPPYIKPTQAGLLEHYQKIAHSVPIPIILYNIPGRTACDLQAETVGALSEISNIIGIKEGTGSLNRLAALQRFCANDFIYLSGDDESAADFMLAGGHGVISVTANIVPALMVELCRLCSMQDKQAAYHLDAQLSNLHQSLFLESNPIPTKWLLSKMTFIQNHLRLPLTPFSEKFFETIYEAYQEAKSAL